MSAVQNPPSAVSSYLRELNRFPLLDGAEFDALILRARAGDREAANRIIQANLRFVVQIASEYTHTGIPFADLLAEGNTGLIKAVDRFDPDRGYQFTTYAVWWIRNAIQRTIRHYNHPLRLPSNRMDDLDILYRSAEALSQRLGRQVSPVEAAETLDMTDRRATAALHTREPVSSMDNPIGEEERRNLHEHIPDPSDPPDADLVRHETAHHVRKALESLEARDAEIVTLTFGLHGESLTLSQVGRRLGISKERVRQLRNRAIGKLRAELQGALDS